MSQRARVGPGLEINDECSSQQQQRERLDSKYRCHGTPVPALPCV